MNPTNGVNEYRTETLEGLLSDYQVKEKKDWWDRERIKAIESELNARKRRKEKA